MILAALIYCCIRRRRPKVRHSYVGGVEKTPRNFFSFGSDRPASHVQDLRREPSSPISPQMGGEDTYTPTPFTMYGSMSAPSTNTLMSPTTISTFQPFTEQPVSALVPTHVMLRRNNKVAEIDQAIRLAVVGSGASSSGASALDPYEVLSPLSPNSNSNLDPNSNLATATAQQTSTTNLSTTVVASSINPTASNQQQQQLHLHPHDSHPVGLPDEPPPQYDAVA
jgi:hypothetical protein